MRKVAFVIVILFFSAWLFSPAASSFKLVISDYQKGLVASVLPAATVHKPHTIYFVGDILLARDVELFLNKYGSSYPYQSTKNLFLSADTVFGNFEAAIPQTHVLTPYNTTNFSVATSHIPALVEAGFTHLSLANNHSFDKGAANFLNTKKTLNENGLTSFGHPASNSSSSVTLVQKNGTVIATIALNLQPGSKLSSTTVQLVEETAEMSDIQIAYIHWGTEYKDTHDTEQQKHARRLIEAGVDLIVGHHPHVVQDIEVYQNKLIIYSLGNFIFDQYFSVAVQQGLVIALEESPQDKQWKLSLLPTTSVLSRAVPQLMTEDEKNEFLEKVAIRSDEAIAQYIRTGNFNLNEELAISPRIE